MSDSGPGKDPERGHAENFMGIQQGGEGMQENNGGGIICFWI